MHKKYPGQPRGILLGKNFYFSMNTFLPLMR